MKACSHCRQEKLESEFSPRQSRCKECRKVYYAAWQKSHRQNIERYREKYFLKRNERRRLKLERKSPDRELLSLLRICRATLRKWRRQGCTGRTAAEIKAWRLTMPAHGHGKITNRSRGVRSLAAIFGISTATVNLHLQKGVSLDGFPEYWRNRLAELAAKKANTKERRKEYDKIRRSTPESRDHRRRRYARYFRERYQSDPEFRLRRILRRRLKKAIFEAGAKSSGRTFELIGCSPKAVRRHLEAQFVGRMSWENYGRSWQVDHIIPCAAFDLTKPDEQRRCFHFTNLQPLWKWENLAKKDRIVDPQQKLLL